MLHTYITTMLNDDKMKRTEFKPEFVELMPDNFEPGIIYISTKYSTSSHICPCGCNERVVLSIRPDGWNLWTDTETVTFAPSIENRWCKAHYFIRKNQVVWV